jgi:hypothetical protein
MAARPFSRCLCLLVCLWAGRGAPAGADPLLLSGEVSLALSPEAASFLPIDIGALAERSCDPLPPPVRDGMAKCHLIASNSGGNNGDILVAKGVWGGDMTTLMASDLNLDSDEGVETSCGLWNFKLTLDPDVPQAASPIVFKENSEDPGHGVFSGVMEISAVLHLVNRDTDQAVDFPLRLGLGMAGPWASVPPEVSPDPLLLFGGFKDGQPMPYDTCIPVWVMQFPEEVEDLVAQGCQICWYPDLERSHEDSGDSTE